MSKYIERWTYDQGQIVGYYEVDDKYTEQEDEGRNIWEVPCSKAWYKQEAQKYDLKQEKKYRSTKVFSHLALKERGLATEEIVKIITQHHIIKTTRSDEKPEMWVYKEGIYIPHGATIVKEVCRQILQDAHTSHLTSDVMAKIQADTYIDSEEFFNKQNEYPYLIPVGNGLLDIKTKELKLNQAIIPFFNKINADYKPNADCPNIKKFLKEILSTDEHYLSIQELIGFCLLKDYKYEKGFMLYGSHGRNGKGKLLELIKRFVGMENTSSVGLQEMEKNGFVIGNLHNKLVNLSGDISQEALKNTGKYKELTGRDQQHADRKFKERIKFVNYAKMVFACNELPPVYTISQAFWLRWVLIEFPYRFLPQKEINALNEEEKNMCKVQDVDIIQKISSQEELDGLLNFALEGLTRLEEQKDFSNKETGRELEKVWKRTSNSVSAFVEDKIKESFDDYIPKGLFLKEYQSYCKKHRVNIMSDKTITITLKDELGIGSDDKQYVDGGQVRIWRGLTWK